VKRLTLNEYCWALYWADPDDGLGLDADGRPVPDGETGDTVITVWVIEPHPSSDYDEIWVRDYHAAYRAAAGVVESRMDSIGEDEVIAIKIRRKRTTLREYAEAMED
jgi:hypothetical protein